MSNSLFPGTPPDPDNDEKGATFNHNRTHRYRCWRTWDDRPPLAWLMLNPSTADETKLDPTLCRVRAFSIAWGFGGFEVWNLWSLRSTDPAGLWGWMREHDQQEHFEANVAAIFAELPRFRDVVCAWGDFSACPGFMRPTAAKVAAAATGITATHTAVWCLGTTKSGQPRHPLYVAGAQPRLPYRSLT